MIGIIIKEPFPDRSKFLELCVDEDGQLYDENTILFPDKYSFSHILG